jgi:hypothetical protein
VHERILDCRQRWARRELQLAPFIGVFLTKRAAFAPFCDADDADDAADTLPQSSKVGRRLCS